MGENAHGNRLSPEFPDDGPYPSQRCMPAGIWLPDEVHPAGDAPRFHVDDDLLIVVDKRGFPKNRHGAEILTRMLQKPAPEPIRHRKAPKIYNFRQIARMG